ncbi:L-serine ammonia-lyase [Telmatospirillum siberiense]|uniref:L-serine dehydratase n=1 Tax=Telmatospirillum siberiense TaxID=382514 RepID=A0A2N3PXN9_9PROT|nr:L-serine ammonia-lyase [Telmatospirillum siberiense]PKU25157.1 L-serine ammonia-lyase [Telmatospirillum siberiense]
MISVFEMFKVGLGPSSSHTVGPMKAAAAFAEGLASRGVLERVAAIETTLYGSLAFTGRGHAVDKAVILGLSGEKPASVEPDQADVIVAEVRHSKALRLAGRRSVGFDPERDLLFDTLTPPKRHPNTLRFLARDAGGSVLMEESWCSIGGGFILREDDPDGGAGAQAHGDIHPFSSADELLARGKETGLSIAALMRANEAAARPPAEVEGHVERVLEVMFDCIERGLSMDGPLPGGLKVQRRAKAIYGRLRSGGTANDPAAHEIMDLVSVYAMAVNEENAAGGRVVTAPTNGAAGVIPAVLRYYRDHRREATAEGLRLFLFTAAAIGGLFKMNASISGAEVGCQGEVGVACAMAAAGLAAALGGSNEQIENAAEIGMEHNLGLTCDPVGGLVQIPCIERNAFGALKAIAAASLALHGDGSHRVSLDNVITTMRQTGADMQSKYKETSLGGLAVNFVDC